MADAYLTPYQERIWDCLCELDGETVAQLFTGWHGMQLLTEEFEEYLETEGYLEETGNKDEDEDDNDDDDDLIFEEGDIVYVSGEVEYGNNVYEVACNGVVMKDCYDYDWDDKVLVTLDEIDGDYNACVQVDKNICRLASDGNESEDDNP